MYSNKIQDLVNGFPTYLRYFSDNNPYSGPSIYFHKKIISLRRQHSLETLLRKNNFIEYLYAVLVSWGMHRMERKSAKLVEYHAFKKQIRDNTRKFLDLENVSIQLLGKDIIDKLRGLYGGFNIMASKKKIVGNSKLLHHILPDLIPPIDNKHTLAFFEYRNNNDSEIFIEIIKKSNFIANRVNWENIQQDNNFNTSIPKIIDNAIIGYVKSHG